MPPSFRDARKSLLRLRPFSSKRRSKRQRGGSSRPAPPSISPRGSSNDDSKGECNGQSSVLISPAGSLDEPNAEAAEGKYSTCTNQDKPIQRGRVEYDSAHHPQSIPSVIETQIMDTPSMVPDKQIGNEIEEEKVIGESLNEEKEETGTSGDAASDFHTAFQTGIDSSRPALPSISPRGSNDSIGECNGQSSVLISPAGSLDELNAEGEYCPCTNQGESIQGVRTEYSNGHRPQSIPSVIQTQVVDTPSMVPDIQIGNEIIEEEKVKEEETGTASDAVSDFHTAFPTGIEEHVTIATLEEREHREDQKRAPRHHGFRLDDYVKVKKKGHKRYGMAGVITKQTKCFIFFNDQETGEAIKIKADSLSIVSKANIKDDQSASVSRHANLQSQTISFEEEKEGADVIGDAVDDFHAAVPTNIDQNSNITDGRLGDTKLRVGQRNASAGHVFNVGDHVIVIKKGHKRYGMAGFITKQTACFTFFNDRETGEAIKIKANSLAFVPKSNSINDDKISLHTESQSERTSAVSHVPSLPKQKPTDYAIKSLVTVVNTHPQHGGKVGIVRRHTTKYVVVLLNESNKEIRISPQFLICNTREATDSMTTMTTSLDTDSELYGSSSLALETSTPFRFGKYPIEKVCLGNSTKGIPVETAFQMIWGPGNYLKVEIPLDPNYLDENNLPLKQTMLDKDLDLYYAEVGEDTSCWSSYNKPKKVTAWYVHSTNLRAHEEAWCDFGSLPPSKVWARRKHFISPATKYDKEHAIKPIAASDLATIEDDGTVGCGFIAEQYLEDLLGNNASAKRTLAIQIRIFVPTRGVFKGMLMRKRGVSGPPIQLNESLMKVGPSRSDAASDKGYIVIKNIFPSKDNFQGVGRLFRNPDRPMTKGFKQGLRKGTSCKLSDMHVRVFQSLGVPNKTFEEYRKVYKERPSALGHTHVVGVADPTNKLPPNSVFLTGTMACDVKLDRLFITRSPCMEAEDGRVIEVIREKPSGMSEMEWDWLGNLAFGALIFGNPRPGDRPLPELIAEGDLDGDLYFVCWDAGILSLVQPVSITDGDLANSNGNTGEKRFNPNWFNETQEFISRVPTLHADIDSLVGKLYQKSYAIEDVRDTNAVCFARAFKQALDAKKHGGPIILPRHLWDDVPEKLHKYLASD